MTQGVFEFSGFDDRKMETRSLGEVEEREEDVVGLVSNLEIGDGGTPCGDMIGMLVMSENHRCQKAEGVEWMRPQSRDMVKGKVATEVWT